MDEVRVFDQLRSNGLHGEVFKWGACRIMTQPSQTMKRTKEEINALIKDFQQTESKSAQDNISRPLYSAGWKPGDEIFKRRKLS